MIAREPSIADLADAFHGLLEIEEFLMPELFRDKRLRPENIPFPISEAGYRALENAMAEAIISQWRGESERALLGFLKALKKWLPEGTQLTDELVERLIDQELSPRLGDALARRCMPKVKGLAADAIAFGRLQQAQKLGILYPRSNEFDQRARDWLVKDTSYWIGNKFDSDVRGNIARIAREVGIEQGLGQIELARELKKQLGGELKKQDYYWEVVGSAAVSRGRKAGAIAQLAEERVTVWEWHTMNDERTCPICSALDGVVMNVETSMSNLQTMMDAPTPDAAKASCPWIAWDNKHEWTDSSGAAQKGSAYYKEGGERKYIQGNIKDGAWLQGRGIADGGQAHGGCRCTLLPIQSAITSEVSSDNQILPVAQVGSDDTAATQPSANVNENDSPLVFTDAKLADEYAQRAWREWIRTRTKAQKSAMRLWSSARYKEINRALRFGGGSKEIKAAIAALKKAISELVINEALMVFRTLKIPYISNVWGEDGSHLIGKILPRDPGFQATSMLESVALGSFSGDILMRIVLEPGATAAYLNPFSMFGGTDDGSQLEMLLPPNTRYVVRQTSNGPGGKKIIDAVVVIE